MAAATATIRGSGDDNGIDNGSNDDGNKQSGAAVTMMAATPTMAKNVELIFIFRNNGELILIFKP